MLSRQIITIFTLGLMISISWGGSTEVSETSDYENAPAPWDEQKFATPKREISVIVTKHGYFPSSISVFTGEKVRFFVTASEETPMCMILPAYSMYLSAHIGKIAEGEVFFDRPGVFDFHCPAGGQKGKITVLARKIYQQRSTASEKKKENVWRPSATPVSY